MAPAGPAAATSEGDLCRSCDARPEHVISPGTNARKLANVLYQWAKFGFNDFAGFMVAWNLWLLGIVVAAGFPVTLLYIVLTIFPTVEVQSRFSFAAKIIIVTITANLLGALIFFAGQRRRRSAIG